MQRVDKWLVLRLVIVVVRSLGCRLEAGGDGQRDGYRVGQTALANRKVALQLGVQAFEVVTCSRRWIEDW